MIDNQPAGVKPVGPSFSKPEGPRQYKCLSCGKILTAEEIQEHGCGDDKGEIV